MPLSDAEVKQIIVKLKRDGHISDRPLTKANLIDLHEKLVADERVRSEPAFSKDELATLHDVTRNNHSFFDFLRTTRQLATDNTPVHATYQQERRAMLSDRKAKVTASEKSHIMGRKLWTDAVSAIDTINETGSPFNNIKGRNYHHALVIQRLKARCYGKTDKQIEVIYDECIRVMQEETLLTLTFPASILVHGLTEFQPLNVFEKDYANKGTWYKQSRNAAERDLFRGVPDPTKTDFLANDHARPRYGAVRLNNRDAAAFTGYGNSFIVFKDTVKHNTLYVPGNALGHGFGYEICSYHHMEYMLSEFPDDAFQTVLDEAQGKPAAGYGDYFSGGSFEFLFPPISVLDPTLIEHIYIDAGTYMLTPDERQIIEDLGIKVTNEYSLKHGKKRKNSNRAFKEAVKNDDVATVESLLKDDPTLISQHFGYIICNAVEHDQFGVLQHLLDNGITFNQRDAKQKTALILASKAKLTNPQDLDLELKIVKYLLENGLSDKSSINQQDNHQNTALIVASAAGHSDIVAELLAYNASIQICNDQQNTALIYACMGGHTQIVENLLLYAATQSEADDDVQTIINFRNEDQDTALICACKAGKKDVVQVLLDNDADTDLHNNNDETALICAMAAGHMDIAQMLIEKGAAIGQGQGKGNGLALLYLCKNGRIDTATLLLDNEADIEFQNEALETPLICASKAGHENIVRLLLQRGAVIDHQDAQHETAIIGAINAGHMHVVQALFDKGATIDPDKKTLEKALIKASKTGNDDTVRLLLGYGADVEYLAKGKTTALMTASKAGHANTVRILLDQGADCEKCDSRHETALMKAVRKGHRDAMIALLEKQQDLTTKNGANQTVIDMAIEHPELLEPLLLHAVTLDHEKRPLLGHRSKLQNKKTFNELLEQGHMEGVMAFLLLEIDGMINAFDQHHRNDVEALNAAKNFQTGLKDDLDIYQQSKKTKQDRTKLFTSWKDRIVDAREHSALANHRGWVKNMLAHVTLFVLTAIVGYLIVGAVTLYKSGGTQFFFNTNTRSVNELHDMESDLAMIAAVGA